MAPLLPFIAETRRAATAVGHCEHGLNIKTAPDVIRVVTSQYVALTLNDIAMRMEYDKREPTFN